METIIGRQTELRILERLYHSKKAEFLALYGRRRIGKTFLVSQLELRAIPWCDCHVPEPLA